MKRVLILVVSSQLPPYGKMMETSKSTWDSVSVDGCETVYYCGQPFKENTNDTIYFDIPESYATMGRKMLCAFEWALENKEFDYVARVNSSCYVDKRELVKYAQTLPDNNIFAGLTVRAGEDYKQDWLWGGGMFTISKDVIKKLVDGKADFNHKLIEDVAISQLATKLNIPYMDGRACSIDKLEKGWRVMAYGCEGFEFIDWNDINKLENQFYFRVKHDPDREVDEFVMKQLFNVLK